MLATHLHLASWFMPSWRGERQVYEISGFRCSVDETLPLLGYYAAKASGTNLPFFILMFQTNAQLPVYSHRCPRTILRSRLLSHFRRRHQLNFAVHSVCLLMSAEMYSIYSLFHKRLQCWRLLELVSDLCCAKFHSKYVLPVYGLNCFLFLYMGLFDTDLDNDHW
jgi:hypothetical protein